MNDITYKEKDITVIKMEEKRTTFMWISSYKVKSRKDVKEIASIGRKRCKIENEGFNVQKNKGYELQHLFSKNKTAMKNHYILIQIAHLIRQLYDKGLKIKKKLRKAIKEMSSWLINSFRNKILKDEDITEIKNNKIQVRIL